MTDEPHPILEGASGPAQPLGDLTDLERVEVHLLLEGIYRVYGFDFRAYSYASIKRRIWRHVQEEGLTTVSALQARVLHDPLCMERLLLAFTINVTSMFRDPSFYLAF